MALTAKHRNWLTLALVPGVGTAYFIRLLARFGTAEGVLKASESQLAEIVGSALATRLKQYADVAEVERQERLMEEYGVRLITLDDPDYPLRLAEVYDPPLCLFVRGTLEADDAYCVGIVGTRKATPYGLELAGRFGRDLAAKGITVVSGMAAGVDAAAHDGALKAGGRTMALLGCGTDVVYPPQNKRLMSDIIENGCVISQFPMGARPNGRNFPIRNRVISGLSMGVLIVEAPLRSGAMITARQAAEQGREVFAIPGPIGQPNSKGPHALIREGAILTDSVDDILLELDLPRGVRRQGRCEAAVPAPSDPPAPPSRRTPKEQPPAQPHEAAQPIPPRPAESVPFPTDNRERTVLAALSHEGSYVDEIADRCGISVAEALGALTILELKGLVRQFSGKRFAPR